MTGKEAVLIFNGAYHGSLFYFSHGASPLNMPMPVDHVDIQRHRPR